MGGKEEALKLINKMHRIVKSMSGPTVDKVLHEKAIEVNSMLSMLYDLISNNSTPSTSKDNTLQVSQNKGISMAPNESAYKFKDLTGKMCETYIRKNHDYGNSFDKSLDKFGLVASVVRIGDKMNRIESLVQKKAMVQDESIRDTLLDMASYCVMTIMWMDNQKKCDVCACQD